MTDEQREHVAYWTRFYSERSESLYRTHSGADKIDAERNRMVAAALRKVLLGSTVAEATQWFKDEWKAFATEQNAKVNAAPKLKYGPMSGQSCISYKYASPCSGEQGETDILRTCKGIE